MERLISIFGGICLVFSSVIIMVIVVSYVAVNNPSVKKGIACTVDSSSCQPFSYDFGNTVRSR